MHAIHPDFKKVAMNLTRDMGLRFSGVDIMLTNRDIAMDPENRKACRYYIIEINSAPGLDHYAASGPTQRRIVEAMYLKVLKAMGKRG